MRSRHGFTLVEIMIALVILAVTVIGLASATGGFLHQVTIDDREILAVQLAEDRMSIMLADPNFGGLDTTYAGTENSFPGLTGYSRVTAVTLVGGIGQTQHHKRIVVTVSGQGVTKPVKRSATVAAP